MNRFLPLLLLLAAIPGSEKNLAAINNMLMATRESVKSVKSGMDNFHAAVTPFMMYQKRKHPADLSESEGEK